jgi:putative transcriptional regulator
MPFMPRLVAIVLLAMASSSAPAQEPQAGQLLYASPSFNDPNFGETVLLLLLHDEQGSRAVALNRPTWVTPAEAFPEIGDLAESEATIFFGGPVSPNQLVIVFDAGTAAPDNARRVFGNIYLTTDFAVLDEIGTAAAGAPRARFFAGHAAWSPGQLEAEIASGNWRVVTATPAQVFADDPATLWNSVPSAGGGVTAMR